MTNSYLPPSKRGPLDPAALEPLADALDALAEWASATRTLLGPMAGGEMDARLLRARAALDLALGREPWAPENWPTKRALETSACILASRQPPPGRRPPEPEEPDCFTCGNARTVDDVAWDEPVRHVPCPACRPAKPRRDFCEVCGAADAEWSAPIGGGGVVLACASCVAAHAAERLEPSVTWTRLDGRARQRDGLAVLAEPSKGGAS